MSFDFKAWAQQPSTILGFSSMVGTLTAALAGQITWAAAAGVLAGGLVAMILPENKQAQQSASNLAKDVVPLVPLIVGAFQHGQANATTPATPPAPAAQ
jgi:hypothetical protein